MAEHVTGDIRPLLMRLGRAATPDVNTHSYPTDLARLAGYDRILPNQHGDTVDPVLVVAGRHLQHRLRRTYPLIIAAPGLALRQREVTPGTTTVIDAAALFHGPWSGATTAPRRHLLDELVELVRQNRQEHLLTYLVPGGPAGADRIEELECLASVVVSPDTGDPVNEGSPSTVLLATLMDYARHGGQH